MRTLCLMLGATWLALCLTAPATTAAQTTPTLFPAQTCAAGGDIIAVTGAGFPPNHTLTVTWAGLPLGTLPDRLRADPLGRLAFTFVVPAGAPGPYTVSVDSGPIGDHFTLTLGRDCPAPPTPTAATPVATSTPLPSATPPTPGPDTPRLTCPETTTAGQSLPFAGTMFHPGAEVAAVRWDGLALPFTAPAVAPDGSLSGRITVPADTASPHTLSVTDERGATAACYPNLLPANPTPTAGPSPTATPPAGPTPGPAIPFPPSRVQPVDGALLNARTVRLRWLSAGLPPGAPPVSAYQVQVTAPADGLLLDETLSGTETRFTARRDYPPNGLTWRVRARNAAGWSDWSAAAFGLDTQAPPAALTLSGLPGTNGWWRSPLTARIGGAEAAFFQPGDTPWQQVVPGAAIPFAREGRFTLRAATRDAAFNRSPVIARPVRLDWSPPSGLSLHFSGPPPASGFFTEPLTISLHADDPVSGVLTRSLRLDGGPWQVDHLFLFAEGRHRVQYLAADAAGNLSPTGQQDVALDRTPPTAELTATGVLCQTCPPLALSVAVSDTLSGVARWTLRADERLLAAGSASNGQAALSGADLRPGPLTLTLTVEDRAGHLTTRTLTLANAAAPAVPTPTPWAFPTATRLPSRTATAALPYVTATPTARATPHPQAPPTATTAPPPPVVVIGNYPVATGTAVPVLLPVTGNEQGKRQNGKGKIITFLKTIIRYSLFIIH